MFLQCLHSCIDIVADHWIGRSQSWTHEAPSLSIRKIHSCLSEGNSLTGGSGWVLLFSLYVRWIPPRACSVVEGFRKCLPIVKSWNDHVDQSTWRRVFHNYISMYLLPPVIWPMCWANGMIGTFILIGFHCSRKQVTIFVMAKELAARCFATKPKRATNSCWTCCWFIVTVLWC